MNDFENDLRQALCRREPPPGFADRVMARVPLQSGRRALWKIAVAAILLMALAGATLWRQEQEREQRLAAERAKAELMFALQITAAELQNAKAMLHRQVGGRRI